MFRLINIRKLINLNGKMWKELLGCLHGSDWNLDQIRMDVLAQIESKT